MLSLAYEIERSGLGINLVREIKALEYGGLYRPMFKTYEDARTFKYRNDIHDREMAKRDKMIEVDETEYAEFFKTVPKYLIQKRGIDLETARAWKIGRWDKGRQGVFFPIYDHDKRFVGYTIRWIFLKDKEPKYFHMPGMNKRKVLYGENMIDKKRSDKFVVVEGPIDALKVYMAGYNPLAALSSSFSDIQASKIMIMCEGMTGYALGDGDKAGNMLSDEVVAKMKERRIKITKISLKDDVDPGDMKPEEIKEVIEGSKK